eukprot:TRINITY_DN1351_c0_g1_i1.p1 TRINITY_DN1351_c0_g1~~TRINITY_DN1351_c0_g1_i1.p1  ORF type:complete len:682 (+),score=195.46 TRINITY_DN1351_c0_g1_i1:1498-3543(+)
MCRPIRALTQAKGYDPRNHILACFGGAGGQHACAIARQLGIKTVFIHKFAGILSAYGLGLANVVRSFQEPCAMVYNEGNMEHVQKTFSSLKEKGADSLKHHGFDESAITYELFLNLRYNGTDTSIMTPLPEDGNFVGAFVQKYKQEYGFVIHGRPIIIDDIRVRAVGSGSKLKSIKISQGQAPKPTKFVPTYFQGLGRHNTPLYLLPELGAGVEVPGPAIIIDNTSTIVVEPDCKAVLTDEGNIRIDVGSLVVKIGTELDTVQLSVFSHRFMSIAEQMGKTLQRTAISTNIKERLDFSCALFGPDGGLVANAPHLPVHLGAMQEAVKWQIEFLKDDWKEGEVIATNHPCAGGSHLPDITVITPVFRGGKAVFYVASRGHHADIGGITPGSLPPFSRLLEEEGAAIKSFKLVTGGMFQEEEITKVLTAPGRLPGCTGTRNLSDNLSDLKAQVAANQKGIKLVDELIDTYSLEVVQAYMRYVQGAAEQAVRAMLVDISLKYNLKPVDCLEAEDFMDDGSPIHLKLTIDREKRTAIFDFTGTGPEIYGNCNAPKSVTMSAIIYSLRCLVKEDIPLNQGCLAPITAIIPPSSILNPSEVAAVVGGNVLTSQRVTDVILQCFRACSCSQGCMNNFTFGDNTFGYYETIAGGGGAGPGWHGESGVHSHMTNTKSLMLRSLKEDILFC